MGVSATGGNDQSHQQLITLGLQDENDDYEGSQLMPGGSSGSNILGGDNVGQNGTIDAKSQQPIDEHLQLKMSKWIQDKLRRSVNPFTVAGPQNGELLQPGYQDPFKANGGDDQLYVPDSPVHGNVDKSQVTKINITFNVDVDVIDGDHYNE